MKLSILLGRMAVQKEEKKKSALVRKWSNPCLGPSILTKDGEPDKARNECDWNKQHTSMLPLWVWD